MQAAGGTRVASARSEMTLSALIAALMANCGDLFDACRQARVSPMFVAQWRKDDKEVHQQVSEAERVGALAIESEAIRRAVRGVDKAVWYKGEECGTETVYSDGLMQTVLKARLPDRYGGTGEGGGNTFINHGNVNMMPRAENYADWLKMRDLTSLSATELAALPAPDEPIDGEFSPVDDDDMLGVTVPIHDDIF